MYDLRTLSSDANNHHNLRYSNGGETNSELSQKHEDSYSNYWYNRRQQAMKSANSGVNSPPPWKNSPSPPKSPSHPLLSHHNYRPLSPDSRADAIVRGRWELMEMVKNMPETSYELSLKDLVEHHRVENQAPQTGDGSVDKNQSLHQRTAVKMKREESRKNVERNLSFENKGLFLNMVFPFSLKSKKKNKIVGNNSGKVSPKPEGSKGGGEKDWWKKKFTGSSDSDTSRTSTSSSSGGGGGGSSSSRRSGTGGRKRKGFSCWPFFHSRRSKSAE